MLTEFQENYTDWLKIIQPDLKEIFNILKKKLSDEPEKLIWDLEEAESWNGRCLYILAQANSFLDQARVFYLPDRDEASRELDRKVLLDSKVAPMREMRDKVEGMTDALKQRLILGESILAYSRQFAEHKTKNLVF